MDALSWARRLLFPSPDASYDFDSHPLETVWIPHHQRAEEEAMEAARQWQRSRQGQGQGQGLGQGQAEAEQQSNSAAATPAAPPPPPPPLPLAAPVECGGSSSSPLASAALPSLGSAAAASPPSASTAPPPAASSSAAHPTSLVAATVATAPTSASASASSSTSSSSVGCCELPAFFLSYRGADLLVVHAHGNGIDIGGMYGLCRFYQRHLRAHFLLFEYSGYGICDGEPSEAALNANLWSVLRFVEVDMCWPLSRVLLFGQSIGSGPCCWAAAWLNRSGRHLAGVVLQSPFTSIRGVAKDLLGSAAASLVSERWPSLQTAVEWMVDPILFLHGVRDELIQCSHSERLYQRCASPHKHLLLLPDATHNDFNLVQDVLQPIAQFIHLYTHIKHRHRLHQPPPQSQPDSSPATPTTTLAHTPTPTLDSHAQVAARPLSVSAAACPPSSVSDVAIRAMLLGNLCELIPIDIDALIPKRFTTVPASAIASHVRRVEARKREEENRQRAKERKELIAGLWERGKASLLVWGKLSPSIPTPPHPPLASRTARPLPSLSSSPSPQSTAPPSPRSSSSAGGSGDGGAAAVTVAGIGPALCSPPAVALPTAVPVPPAPPPPPRLSAASRLSICVATAAKVAGEVVELVDHSYSSPRARLLDPSSPCPSPSASSHQQSIASHSHSYSHSHSQSHSLLYLFSSHQHSPSLGVNDEKEDGGGGDGEGGGGQLTVGSIAVDSSDSLHTTGQQQQQQ